VVVDDMDRENEGDIIMAADACTPEDMARINRIAGGLICVAMNGERMDELDLPAMVTNNEDPKGTAFSVSIDATKEHGKRASLNGTNVNCCHYDFSAHDLLFWSYRCYYRNQRSR